MNNKTKFNIGNHVWVIHYSKTTNELYVFDDRIVAISYVNINTKPGYKIKYEIYKNCNDYDEDELVLFHDVSGLNKKINDTITKIKEMSGLDVKKIYKEDTEEDTEK